MTRWLVGVAVVAAAFPMSTPASADHLCVGIVKVGTFGPPVAVGPVCAETGLTHHCRITEIGVVPTLRFDLHTCTPR